MNENMRNEIQKSSLGDAVKFKFERERGTL
jgi:hypothetical protein